MPILIVIIILAALGYFYYSGTSLLPSSTLETTDNDPVTDQIGAQILNLSNQISTLSIDTSLFRSAAFMSLQDYTVDIPSLPVGRPNPFAPIPGMPVQTSVPTTGR